VLDAVGRLFPSVRAEAATLVPRGDSSAVFLLGARGRTSWVGKFYPVGGPPDLRAAVCGGIRVVERLGDKIDTVRVPRVLRSCDGDVLPYVGGHLLQVQEYLPGARVPLHLVSGRGLEQLGSALALVHAVIVEVPDRNHMFMPGAAARRTLLRADERFPAAGFRGALDAVEQVRRRAELAIAAADISTAATVMVHGDVVADNLLVDGGALALIDWDGVHRAPREYEFGTIALDDPGALAAVVRGYQCKHPDRLDAGLTAGHAARYLLFGLEFHLERALSGTGPASQRRHDLREAQRYASSCRNWQHVEAAILAAMPRPDGKADLA